MNLATLSPINLEIIPDILEYIVVVQSLPYFIIHLLQNININIFPVEQMLKISTINKVCKQLT